MRMLNSLGTNPAEYSHLEWPQVRVVYIRLAEMAGELSTETELDDMNAV